MAKSVHTGIEQMSFKGIELDAQVLEWTDSRNYRLSVHEYLKRDGGAAEYLGRKPHRVKFKLVFIGANWRKDFNRLLASLDKTPLGLLNHPFFGKMQVACEGVEQAAVNSENGIDTVYVPISFVENNVDQTLQDSSTTEGPTAKQQRVTTYVAALNTATSIYALASATVSLFMTTTVQWAASAVTTLASNGVPDPTLPGVLARCASYAASARAAIMADPAYTNDAAAYTALINIDLVLAACYELDEALKQTKSTLQIYIVPAQCSLMSILQTYYGKDALQRFNEVLANNPGKISNPAALAAGTELVLASPTVVSI